MTDHPISGLYIKSLIDYRTPDAVAPGTNQDIGDLTIGSSRKSKRLTSESLVKYWENNIHEIPSEWRPWLKRDPILRRIEQQDRNNDYREKLGKIEEISTRHSSIFTKIRSDLQTSSGTRPPTPNNAFSHTDNSSARPAMTERLKIKQLTVIVLYPISLPIPK